ncbi:MAG: hypothetical protein ACOC9T_03495 [Myxococcota bacterium]
MLGNSYGWFNYDDRGNVSTEYRRAVLIPQEASIPSTIADDVPAVEENDDTGATGYVKQQYVSLGRSYTYDFGNRPTRLQLPRDPDRETLGGSGTAPLVRGHIEYNKRGLPDRIHATLDSSPQGIIESIKYAADRQVEEVVYGDDQGGSREPTKTKTQYDVRRRPKSVVTTREPHADPLFEDDIVTPIDTTYEWDAVSNLTHVEDRRDPEAFPTGVRPANQTIDHDALYRGVTSVFYEYHDGSGGLGSDTSFDWREQRSRANDDGQTHGATRP